MKANVKHFGYVKGLRTFFNNPDLWKQQLFILEGKNFEIVIKERKRPPSPNQHAYYRFAVLHACFESEDFKHMDNPDQIHEDYFAPKFLSFIKIVTVGDKSVELKKVKSMGDMSKGEVSDFMDRVLADCAMMGIIVLSPHEYELKTYGK